MRKFLKVPLSNRVDNGSDEAILLKLEVPLLDVLEELFSTALSNQESGCGAAAFESDLSSVLEVSNQKVLLDEVLVTFIPVCVP